MEGLATSAKRLFIAEKELARSLANVSVKMDGEENIVIKVS